MRYTQVDYFNGSYVCLCAYQARWDFAIQNMSSIGLYQGVYWGIVMHMSFHLQKKSWIRVLQWMDALSIMNTNLFLYWDHLCFPFSSKPRCLSHNWYSSSSRNSKNCWEVFVPTLIWQKLIPLSVNAQIAVEHAGFIFEIGKVCPAFSTHEYGRIALELKATSSIQMKVHPFLTICWKMSLNRSQYSSSSGRFGFA